MKVAVIMGSSSDYNISEKALKTLERFGVEYEVRVISAHRALDVLKNYVESFEEKGIEVVVAVAGKAAHLPGVVAGMTTLPVIGVPVLGSAFTGMDALLSIVQMPKGVPVATVAVDGAENAAILAVQMLAIKDKGLKSKLIEYKHEMQMGVLEQDKSIRR